VASGSSRGRAVGAGRARRVLVFGESAMLGCETYFRVCDEGNRISHARCLDLSLQTRRQEFCVTYLVASEPILSEAGKTK
jgi:hypothetical protein